MNIKHWYAKCEAFVLDHKWTIGTVLILVLLVRFTQWSFELKVQSPLAAASEVKTEKSTSLEDENPPLSSNKQASTVSPIDEQPMAKATFVHAKEDQDASPTTAFEAQEVKAFVKRFAKVAKQEQAKFGIPASITLALSLYQSNGGTNAMIAEANNYFKIPANSDWPGESYDYNGNKVRKYSSAWSSFRDHSTVLVEWLSIKNKTPKEANAQVWLKAIESSDYLPQKTLASVKQLIQTFQLEEIDKLEL